MNRLLCFLTGGHRYADVGVTATQQKNPDWFTIRNECIKCGKVAEFECNVGAIIRSDIAKMKNINNPQCPDCKHFAGCECFSGMTCDQYDAVQEQAADTDDVVLCKDCFGNKNGSCMMSEKLDKDNYDPNYSCGRGYRE